MDDFEGIVLAMLCVWLYLRHEILSFWLYRKQQRDLDYSSRQREIRQRNDDNERTILQRLYHLDEESEEEVESFKDNFVNLTPAPSMHPSALDLINGTRKVVREDDLVSVYRARHAIIAEQRAQRREDRRNLIQMALDAARQRNNQAAAWRMTEIAQNTDFSDGFQCTLNQLLHITGGWSAQHSDIV